MEAWVRVESWVINYTTHSLPLPHDNVEAMITQADDNLAEEEEEEEDVYSV